MIDWASLSRAEHVKVYAALDALADDIRAQVNTDAAAGRSNRLMDACTIIAAEANRAIADLARRERILQALGKQYVATTRTGEHAVRTNNRMTAIAFAQKLGGEVIDTKEQDT